MTSSAGFDGLLSRVHELGREVVQPAAAEVDRDARFPAEALGALKACGLLGAYVPRPLGGLGLDVAQVARICEVLGHYDGSVAMIYAMHSIQVACVVHHADASGFFRAYLAELAGEQRLVASATTEVGTGGDLRSSICAVALAAGRFELTKKAPVISYGAHADDILVTCRRSADAPASDQVQVLVKRGAYRLDPASGWDTLGFRGTCSAGFVLHGSGAADQILPAPFADILARTMHPFAHIVWSSLWLGIASDALGRAREVVRRQARASPQGIPASATRLAEADGALQSMRSGVACLLAEYEGLLRQGRASAFEGFAFAIRTNNLKLAASMQVVDLVGRALLICGIEGYRNDSRFSLCRHLRDAYGAALMVNNDRILGHNATMLLGQRDA